MDALRTAAMGFLPCCWYGDAIRLIAFVTCCPQSDSLPLDLSSQADCCRRWPKADVQAPMVRCLTWKPAQVGAKALAARGYHFRVSQLLPGSDRVKSELFVRAFRDRARAGNRPQSVEIMCER